jgi:hypothetical protein
MRASSGRLERDRALARGARAGLRGGLVGAALALVSGSAQAQSIDLLHAVSSEVAVSSVYRNQAEQAEALVDGSLDTAWNSRSGELTTSWIEFRVPASARVASVDLTVGFTKMLGRTDLFVGNHRVRRVRVLREGTLVREQLLNTELRELQSVPINAQGGVFRIEIAETIAGTRRDWREVCVSELRVMGSDPSARPGARFPRVGVGALPAPWSNAPPDRAQVARAHGARVSDFEQRWLSIERIASSSRVNSAEEEDRWPRESQSLMRTRRAVLGALADFAAPIDALEADALRIRARLSMDPHWSSTNRETILSEDLATIARVMEVVHRFVDDESARCRWARAMSRVYLRRATAFAQSDHIFSNMDASQSEAMGTSLSRGERRRLQQLEALRNALESAEGAWSGNARAVAQRIQHLAPPANTRAERDLTALRAQLALCERACGWR